ncbi:MAG: hypothetical protein R2748_35695 [Bryobacterales bacterium]
MKHMAIIAAMASFTALVSPAQAQVYFSRVNVCNEGNTNLAVGTLTVIEYLFSTKALMDGWYLVEPGQCRNVVQESESVTANIGFAYQGRDKRWVPYAPDFGLPERRTRYGVKMLCAPMAVRERGATDVLFLKYADRSDCPAGYFHTKVSAIIKADPPATQTLELSPTIR